MGVRVVRMVIIRMMVIIRRVMRMVIVTIVIRMVI